MVLYRTVRIGLGFAALFGALVLTGEVPSRAQQPIPGAEGERALDCKDLKSDERNRFNKMREGQIEPEATDRALLEKAAQWYVYRVTSPIYQHRALPDSSDPTTLNGLVIQCNQQLPERGKMHPNAAIREKQYHFLAAYGKAVTKAANEVLKNPMPIARVNAARILAHLGKVGPEEIGDSLLTVVEDKEQLEAVKLYALRGLKDLYQTVSVSEDNGGWPKSKGKFKDSAREARIATALAEFIHRAPKYPKEASPEEREAFRYLRREAVRALAAGHSPQVLVKREVKAQPALELLKVVSKDGFTPEPSMSERIEAAIGVCQMRPSKIFQPDYAALHVGHFLLDFVNDFNNDKKNPPYLRAEPWHLQATRLRLGLQEMAAAAKNKNLDSLVKRAVPVLESIEKDQIPTATPLLKSGLGRYKCEKTLFKEDAASTVKLPSGEAE